MMVYFPVWQKHILDSQVYFTMWSGLGTAVCTCYNYTHVKLCNARTVPYLAETNVIKKNGG